MTIHPKGRSKWIWTKQLWITISKAVLKTFQLESKSDWNWMFGYGYLSSGQKWLWQPHIIPVWELLSLWRIYLCRVVFCAIMGYLCKDTVIVCNWNISRANLLCFGWFFAKSKISLVFKHILPHDKNIEYMNEHIVCLLCEICLRDPYWSPPMILKFPIDL